MEKIQYYNRIKQRIDEETVFSHAAKKFFYGTWPGRIAVRLFFKRRIFSRWYGKKKKTEESVSQIRPFIQEHNIDMSQYEKNIDVYTSFNDFFIRKIKPEARPMAKQSDILIAPADSKVLVSAILHDTVIPLKGYDFTLPELYPHQPAPDVFKNGLCAVFRLCPWDYHRFCFVDEGSIADFFEIKGSYHVSGPAFVARFFPIYHGNYRHCSLLDTKNFGKVLCVEVGAMTIGSIVQHKKKGTSFYRGEEKGYFQYGGSTILLLFQKDAIVFDKDVISYSNRGIETSVLYGSAIGRKK